MRRLTYTAAMNDAAFTANAPTLPHPILSALVQIGTEDLDPRRMMGRIAQALADAFGWEFIALVSVDTAAGRFVCEAVHTQLKTDIHVGYSRPLGSGIVGRVAATGEAILVNDASEFPDFINTLEAGLSELCVPVLHRGELLAVLNIESQSRGAFADQLPLLQVVAVHIAGAIAAAQRVATLRRQSVLLNLVANFSRRALEASDLDELLELVLDFLSTRFNTLEASVLLESDLRDHLEVMRHLGASSHISYVGKQWPISAGIVGQCYRSGEVVFAADIRSQDDYVEVNPAVVAEMAVPIRIRGRVFGVLNLEADSADVFAEDERLIFTAIADQVAGAIHLLAMHQKLKQTQQQSARRGEELTTTREHLRRAVVKLDRRAQNEHNAGTRTTLAFMRMLRADLRAVARGGRSLAAAIIRALPVDNSLMNQIEDCWPQLIAEVERQFPEARISRLGERLSLYWLPTPEWDTAQIHARMCVLLDALPISDLDACIARLPAGASIRAEQLMDRLASNELRPSASSERLRWVCVDAPR